MQPETDLTILGGGCAGLSLAMRLADLGEKCPHTRIIEARSCYEDDRTWCFWDDGFARLGQLIEHRWTKVELSNGQRKVGLECSSNPYAMIRAGNFYKTASERIRSSPKIELAMNEILETEPTKKNSVWNVQTNKGLRVTKRIIDTRPTKNPKSDKAILWQSFSGQEVECALPRFDRGTAKLMDFYPTDKGRIAFLYLLPISAHRALIESTVLAPQRLHANDLAKDLAICIERGVSGSDYRVIRSEHGIIPMGQYPTDSSGDDSYVRAGMGAGAARAASGFAFQRIQRWAESCARSLSEGRAPIGHPRDGRLIQFMDKLFLNVLKSQPEIAPDLFLRLFNMRNSSRIVRFLGDGATLIDCAAIMMALPPKPFLRQLCKGLTAHVYPKRGSNTQ